MIAFCSVERLIDVILSLLRVDEEFSIFDEKEISALADIWLHFTAFHSEDNLCMFSIEPFQIISIASP